jgi:uncharacterized protein (TIGR03545 family)
LERLRQQLAADQRAVDAAKEHDLQQLRELASLEGLNPRSLTDYLLGEPLRQRVKQLNSWLSQARTGFGYVAKEPEWNRQGARGTDLLLSTDRRPSVLIRSLLLAGQGTADGGEFSFAGRASNLTYQPRRHDQPAVFELSFQGSVDAQVRAVIDHRGTVPKHRFTIQCSRLVHDAYTLGRDDQWAVEVGRGAASVWIDLEFIGDELSGDLRWREDELQLRAMGSGRKSARVAQSLQGALDEIDRLHAHVSLSGSAKHPELRLRSNLGPDLSRGMQLAARRELSALSQKLATRLEVEVKQQMARLTASLSEEQAELLAVLQSNQELVDGLQQLAAVKLPQEIFGVRVADLFRNGLEAAP